MRVPFDRFPIWFGQAEILQDAIDGSFKVWLMFEYIDISPKGTGYDSSFVSRVLKDLDFDPNGDLNKCGPAFQSYSFNTLEHVFLTGPSEKTIQLMISRIEDRVSTGDMKGSWTIYSYPVSDMEKWGREYPFNIGWEFEELSDLVAITNMVALQKPL